MGQLQDYYNTSPAYGSFKIDSANDIIAGVFQAGATYGLKSVKIKVYRVGSPGNIDVTIQGTTASGGGYRPDESDLLTPNIFDGNAITTDTSGEWIEIVFADTASIVSGTRYVVRLDGESTDGSNYIRWVTDDGNQSYAENVAFSSNNAGSYSIFLNWGAMFEAYDNVELPGAPTNPSPSDAASDITLDESPLSWDASNPAADTYEIYFREQGDAWSLLGSAQAGVSFVLDFGTLDYGTTYEWRIDATNTDGTTTGTTWSFNSLVFDEIQISYKLIIGGNGNGPYDDPPGVEGTDWESTGENNIITLRRLIAAANNKIWYEDI